jgi:hypothetical protein
MFPVPREKWDPECKEAMTYVLICPGLKGYGPEEDGWGFGSQHAMVCNYCKSVLVDNVEKSGTTWPAKCNHCFWRCWVCRDMYWKTDPPKGVKGTKPAYEVDSVPMYICTACYDKRQTAPPNEVKHWWANYELNPNWEDIPVTKGVFIEEEITPSDSSTISSSHSAR